MISIKFNDSPVKKQVHFSVINESIVELKGEKIKANDSGFVAYRLNGAFLGDYSAYTHIVKEEKGLLQLSK